MKMSEEFTKVPADIRPPVRGAAPSAAREESPRERAERITREFYEHNTGSDMDAVDKYYIPEGLVPDGWTYEWKRKLVLGAEDPSYEVALARRGWQPVPAARHPEMMPMGYRGVEIVRDGLVLMERPQAITDDVRASDLRRARVQVRAKEEQLSAAPPGQFERTNKGNDMVKVKRSFEAMPIPDE
jgi:hypothetical protein